MVAEVPHEWRAPVAIVGAGLIVTASQLPAYRLAGVDVRGIFDLDRARAQSAAQAFGLPRVYGSLDELLDDDIQVVDIAVPGPSQPEIARRAIGAGTHVLAQKPLSVDSATALELVEAAEKAGVALVVNQQLRYEATMTYVRELLSRGGIGVPRTLSWHCRGAGDWTVWPWLRESPYLEVMYHSIHYLDTFRSWFGEPSQVFCRLGRRKGQFARAETTTQALITFRDEVTVLVDVDVEALYATPGTTWSLTATEGGLEGVLDEAGTGGGSVVRTRRAGDAAFVDSGIRGRWSPDAFAGPMLALLRQVATGEPAPTTGRDNLGTLRLVEAMYASADTGQVVALPQP